MNEQQNLALIQKIFEAFGRGDIQDMLDCFAADSEVYYPGPAIIPYAGKKKGHAELRDYFQGILENQSNHDLKSAASSPKMTTWWRSGRIRVW